jgi:5-methylcytosine-specific restriction enzyme subunit McrC
MGRELKSFENAPIVIDLTAVEATSLTKLGQELASKSIWWGNDQINEDRSVIHVDELSGGRYRVTFRDVIGVVRVGTTQFSILPKIAESHFWHIVCQSELVPRISTTSVGVADGAAMIQIIADWCVTAAERLLRGGLRKEYRDVFDELAEVRGQIHVLATAQRFYAGVPAAMCSFEELSDDSPLNRLVKSACERIACLNGVNASVRQRAQRVVFRMDGVGVASENDRRVRLERLTTRYSQVLPLALLILNGYGISAKIGLHVGTAFLIRTPELIEDGLRSILVENRHGMSVKKRKLWLGDSGLSLNPDLVFGSDIAIGDIKYRKLTNQWSDSDRNQIVTFATGFCCRHAALVGFSSDEDGVVSPPAISIGAVALRAFTWSVAEESSPEQSQVKFIEQLDRWLTGIVST